ncbi:hypothetical protein NDU88_004213 [Pleurodeles waltl]|uniref:Uncharacterized protein n=1 Tax=Pleurodeles waltl TaxID=8319 RepID=A0AAV7SI77_PLEWA|nr:hypothetical protein NDU88_004213 [Pleurodeles waltl]
MPTSRSERTLIRLSCSARLPARLFVHFYICAMEWGELGSEESNIPKEMFGALKRASVIVLGVFGVDMLTKKSVSGLDSGNLDMCA